MMTPKISVGVFDWMSFAEPQGYYPEDIPAEWKLSYYSNDFNSACLSLAALTTKPELLTEWVSDLPQTFELSFYLQQVDQIPILQSLLQTAHSPVYSLIVHNAESNNLLHKESLQSVLSAELEIVEFKDIWTPMAVSQKSSGIAIFPQAENMREYRSWIDQWLTHDDPDAMTGHKTLWLQGAQTSYQQLSEIRMLTELMGY